MLALNLIGQCLEKTVPLINKYGIEFDKEDVVKNVQRLTNQLWKIIPMREQNEDWKKQLNTVLIEITGMNELLIYKSEGFQLLSKLEGMLQTEDMSFDLYRKTVFESISLLQEINRGIWL